LLLIVDELERVLPLGDSIFKELFEAERDIT
jgi:hypothetical protein